MDIITIIHITSIITHIDTILDIITLTTVQDIIDITPITLQNHMEDIMVQVVRWVRPDIVIHDIIKHIAVEP
jgi:hypothetical protein